ncbi:MAG: flap structure-specific endonuclease, partial [Thermoplasmata archaeon]|nr:flap structure-specific endonuclease [Thermoplasmata archaeon]
MGIKLGDLVEKRKLIDDELQGKIITIDGYNHLYQFLSSIRTPEGYLLTNADGRVISHLKGIFSRSANLLSKNIKIVYIFDGVPHPLKKNTLDLRRERKEKAIREWEDALARGDLSTARTKAQQTTHLTEEMVSDTKMLLDLMGIPHITAPGEGEAQAAIMVSRGDAFASSSQDY